MQFEIAQTRTGLVVDRRLRAHRRHCHPPGYRPGGGRFRAGAASRAVVLEGAAGQRERPGIENSAATRATATLASHETGAANRAIKIHRAIDQRERSDIVNSPTLESPALKLSTRPSAIVRPVSVVVPVPLTANTRVCVKALILRRRAPGPSDRDALGDVELTTGRWLQRDRIAKQWRKADGVRTRQCVGAHDCFA